MRMIYGELLPGCDWSSSEILSGCLGIAEIRQGELVDLGAFKRPSDCGVHHVLS